MGSNKIDIELGKKIYALRTGRNETQVQLQKAMGLSHRETINQWECGDRQVKAEYLVKLSKHYGVSVDYLLGLYPNPSIDKDVKQVTNYTGLSDGAVARLHEWSQRRKQEHDSGYVESKEAMELKAVSTMLEFPSTFFHYIYQFLFKSYNRFLMTDTDENNADKDIVDNSVSLCTASEDGTQLLEGETVFIEDMPEVFLLRIQRELRYIHDFFNRKA